MTTPEPAEYVRRLEDVVDMLWGWMPAEQVREIRSELPGLVGLCHHVHHKVSHEEAMVRQSEWMAQPAVSEPVR